MTNKELIVKLSTFPDDALVYIEEVGCAERFAPWAPTYEDAEEHEQQFPGKAVVIAFEIA